MSITSALVARRAEIQNKRIENKEDGFTLIELLVVVIIIGILAAIAIPIYIGVTNGAKDSAAQSDLTSAKTAVIAAYSQNGTWTALSTDAKVNATTATLTKNGWSSTTAVDDSKVAGGSETAFCIAELSGSGKTWYITDSVAPTSTKPTASCN